MWFLIPLLAQAEAQAEQVVPDADAFPDASGSFFTSMAFFSICLFLLGCMGSYWFWFIRER